MKKKKNIISAVLICALALLILIGIFITLFARTKIIRDKQPRSGITIKTVSAECDDDKLKEEAVQILAAIRAQDYVALSEVVHPEYGILFSPYPTVNLSSDRCLTAAQVSDFSRDFSKYIWGTYDGTGEPIDLTVQDYLSRFVLDAEFEKGTIAVNAIQHTGNALENLEEVFDGCRYVDFYLPASEADGLNWRSIHLVFEEYKGRLFLTAIIHSEYTV